MMHAFKKSGHHEDSRDSTAHTVELEQFYSSGGALKLWDDKEAWKVRTSAEGEFYIKVLQQERASRILDIAAASGYHTIQLCRAGFTVAAVDGLREFVDAGIRNQKETNTEFPFIHSLWSDLRPELFEGTTFDAVICLGGSLHHTDLLGVQDLFLKVKGLLKPEGIFIIEQRNYERLFRERPREIPHPCGWTYHIEYQEPRTIYFNLTEPFRGVNARCLCTTTFEHELIWIALERDFRLKQCYYDFGRCPVREEASWIQYIFKSAPHEGA